MGRSASGVNELVIEGAVGRMTPKAAIRTAVVLNLLATSAGVAWTYQAFQGSDEGEQRVRRTQETLGAIEDTLRRVVDVEAAARAQQLTRNARDQAAFRAARAQVRPSFDHLSVLLRAAGRGPDADALLTKIADALDGFDRVVDRAAAGETLDAPTRGLARAHMDAVRAQVRRIRRAERDDLAEQILTVASASRWAKSIAMVMTGAAAMLLTTLLVVLFFLWRPGLWRV